MNDYNMGMLNITFESNDPKTDLDIYVVGYYDQFNTYFCNKQTLDGLQEICENLDNFKDAGIAFLIISSLGHFVMFYGMLHVIAKLLKTTRAFFLFGYAHFIYPLIYSVALAIYLGVTEVFTLEPPANSKNGSDVEARVGIFAIFLAEALCISSMIFFWFSKSKLEKSSILIADTEKNSQDIKFPSKGKE